MLFFLLWNCKKIRRDGNEIAFKNVFDDFSSRKSCGSLWVSEMQTRKNVQTILGSFICYFQYLERIGSKNPIFWWISCLNNGIIPKNQKPSTSLSKSNKFHSFITKSLQKIHFNFQKVDLMISSCTIWDYSDDDSNNDSGLDEDYMLRDF